MGGRAKGTPNKSTSEVKEWVKMVLEHERGRFMEDLDYLQPYERVKTILGLLPYVVPKVSEVNLVRAQVEELGRLLMNAPLEAQQAIADLLHDMHNQATADAQGEV